MNDTVTAIAYGGTPEAERAKWNGLIGSKYVIGDIHATDVTPLLWRSLDVELRKSDGSIASIQMMRPLWWLEQTGAKEGGTINLEVTEAGLYGEARIRSIKADVKADSRQGPPGSALVIGKIRHENAKVISLVLNNDESNALGVTPNHPLYSKDRDQWVEAGAFKIGEAIETSDGSVAKVTAKRERVSPEPVYNLEVHRAKSYYVGSQGLLAHNTGIGCSKNTRKLWEINRFDRQLSNSKFGTFKRDPDTGLWWSRDTAGHGGSAWKVYQETGRGLEWFKDADKYGTYLKGKHKGPVGKFIPWDILN